MWPVLSLSIEWNLIFKCFMSSSWRSFTNILAACFFKRDALAKCRIVYRMAGSRLWVCCCYFFFYYSYCFGVLGEWSNGYWSGGIYWYCWCNLMQGFSPRSRRNHGWFKLSLAEIRETGLISSRDFTKSLAYALTQFHSFCDIKYIPNLIFIKTYVAFLPVNGMYPLSRM